MPWFLPHSGNVTIQRGQSQPESAGPLRSCYDSVLPQGVGSRKAVRSEPNGIMDAASESYKQTIRELSDRIVEAQRPIRVLDAIKWDLGILASFFESGCKALPAVDAAYYGQRPLPFDPQDKKQEFNDIERDIQRVLGQFNPVGVLMQRMCREYRMVVRMLESRGKPEFSEMSQKLYGSASDAFHAGDPTLNDLATMLTEALENIDRSVLSPAEERTISGEEAVAVLQRRLREYFHDADRRIRVRLSDGIVADAAAGSDYIKIRKEARFSERDLRLMEIHEGWVHVGTTLNGLNQPVCTFLGKGPPSSTVTQEGLAIIVEILAFASHPARLRRLTNRIHGVHMAESGANFLEVFEFYRSQGFPDVECYTNAVRVFRGSTPEGPPFTKDICYSKGFVLTYNYLRLAVLRGKPERLPLLFCGKTTLEDMRTLASLVEEGLVVPPKHVPPPFADLNALVSWMCYSSFLSRLNLQRIEADYAQIL